MRFLLAIFLFTALASMQAQAADAPLCGALKQMAQTVSETYEDITADHSPFRYVCQDPASIKGRPKTNILKRAVPQQDALGRKSSAFLKLVAAKVRQKIEENKNMVANLKGCIKSTAPFCRDAKEWATKTLPEYVKDARFNLSIAQSPHQMDTVLGIPSPLQNWRMESPGIPKLVPWKYISDQELPVAVKALNTYRCYANEKAAGQNKKEADKIFLVARYRHFVEYQRMIAEVPLMQYIETSDPTPQDILNAVNRMGKNLAREEELLAQMEYDIGAEPVSGKALGIMNYSTLVEETLIEHPEFCGLASSLQYTSDGRALQNAIALALPILAVSIFAPPAAVAGATALGATAATAATAGTVATASVAVAGAAVGAGFAADSQRKLNNQRAQSLSQFYGNFEELEKVRQAETERNFNVIMMPLAFTGIGGGAKTASATRNAVGIVKKLPRFGRKGLLLGGTMLALQPGVKVDPVVTRCGSVR